MSLLPLASDETFDRLPQQFPHFAAGGLRERGEFFVRLFADLCPNVLQVLSHYVISFHLIREIWAKQSRCLGAPDIGPQFVKRQDAA